MVFLFFVVFFKKNFCFARCLLRIKFACFTPKTIKNGDKSFNF